MEAEPTPTPSSDDDDARPTNADEVEQQQRLDGTREDAGVVGDAPRGGPVTADVVEQHQRPDGSVDGGDALEVGTPAEEARTPDVVDQRRPVTDDEDDRDDAGR